MAKILIVDDEAAVRESLLVALGSFGYTARAVSTVRDALPLLPGIDLLITDLLMADQDGLELILAARKSVPTLKIIAISGGGRVAPSAYLKMAAKLGADLTLTKPFSLEELRHAISCARQGSTP